MSSKHKPMPSSEKEKITLQSGPTTTVYTLKAVPETHDGEYSDQEILSLVNYFESSRAELKNRVDSLLAQPIVKSKEFDAKAPKLFEDDYIKTHGNRLTLKLYAQGDEITLPIASTLRLLTNNTTLHSFSKAWLSAKFAFRDYTDPLNFGLVADRTGARGLILAVQGFVIRHLLLKNALSSTKHRSVSVTVEARTEALVDAITEILWQAGDSRGASICVPYGGDQCFTNYGEYYVPDGLTERLHMFEFVDIAKLRSFVIKCLPYFMKENGVVIFLYSLMLSRTLKKLIEDLNHTRLIGDRDESNIQLITLALTGRALHYLHNGIVEYDAKGNLLEKPHVGIQNRSLVGFMYWSKYDEDNYWQKQEVGSMLRTPKVPVWLIYLNRRFALVFSTNINLLNNWIHENYFQLHIYTGLRKQEEPCIVSIDTREQYSEFKYSDPFGEKDSHVPDMIQLLQTRWPGCIIDNAETILHDLMTLF